MAPRSASTSLKKGNAIATEVTSPTKTVLQVSLKKLMLKFKVLLPIPTGYSAVTNLDIGHLRLACDSTAPNTGCASTCTSYIYHLRFCIFYFEVESLEMFLKLIYMHPLDAAQ